MPKTSKLIEERRRQQRFRLYLVVVAVSMAGTVVAANVVLNTPQASPAGNAATACPTHAGNRCAVIHVAAGDIVFEIYENEVQNTATHFINLMLTGYYNGMAWHRVEDWVIQTGQGSDVATIAHEWSPNLHNDRAMVGVARTSDPNSGSSQFYILRSDARHLDYKSASDPGYTVFGRVLRGMDLVDLVRLDDRIVQLTVVSDYPAS